MFDAIYLEKPGDAVAASVRPLDDEALPAGDVTVRIDFSTLNYKDALAITGRAPVVRHYPMVPGIDLAGTVEASDDPAWHAGDEVILNGWGVGETHWGGLAQRARLRGEWLLQRPAALSARQCMAVGTAGYTAMLSILALERHGLTPESGEVVVTGAAGGVGSFAVALLARRGYRVVAATGRTEAAGDYLRQLGAAEVIDRAEFTGPGKPLGKARWAGAIDSVGSHTLANVLATTDYDGAVAACGLAGGMELPATVAPFILRGVTLIGINSVTAPHERREAAWARLATDLDAGQLDTITETIPLAEAIPAAWRLLAGAVRGRLVVDVNA